MIMFMELSYRDDNYIDRVLNHKKPLTESELYKIMVTVDHVMSI